MQSYLWLFSLHDVGANLVAHRGVFLGQFMALSNGLICAAPYGGAYVATMETLRHRRLTSIYYKALSLGLFADRADEANIIRAWLAWQEAEVPCT